MKRPRIIDRLALALGYVRVEEAIDRMGETFEVNMLLQSDLADQRGEHQKQIEEWKRICGQQEFYINTLRNELAMARAERDGRR